MTQPAGWYPYPDNPSLERYWDGTKWHSKGRWVPGAKPPASSADQAIAWIIAILSVGYMVPWAISVTRETDNQGAVLAVNLFLGWTLIGWVVALAMSLGNPHR